MLSLSSRYQGLPIATYQPSDGAEPVPYLTRRFLPASDTLTPIGLHVVTATDRLDRIATARFGDPEMFWRIADANPVLQPDDLTQEPGRVLVIALPTALVGSPRAF